MELWFKDNYFVDELMIRCGADGQFEPLSSLMAKYGRSSPFLGHDDAMAIAAKTPASRFRAEPLRTGSGIQDRIGGDLAGGAPFVPYSPFGAFDQPHASPIQTAGMMSSSFPGQGRFYNSNFVEQPPLRDAYGNPGVAFGSGWADSRQPGYGFSQLGGAPRPWAPALGSQIGLGNSGLGLNRLGVGHVGPGGSGIGAASPAIGTDSAGLSHFLTGIGASQLSDSINQHSPPSQETKAAESSGATSAAYTGQVSSLSLFGDSMAPAVPEPKSWLAVQSQTTQGDPKLVSSPTQPEADVALAGDGFSTTANVVEEPSEVPAVAVAAQDPVETPSKDAAQSLPPTSSVAIAKAAKKSAKAKVDSTNEAPTKPDEPPAPSQKSKKASKQESKAAVAAAIASQQPASNGQPSASAGTVWKTPSTPSLTQSKSLKEIQEAEEREREAKERERQRKAQAAVLAEAQSIAEMEAAMAVNSAAVASGSGVWGTSSKSTVKSKTMAEIMEEERRRTEAAAAAASAALAASASTTTSPTASVGKRHTESAAPSSGWVAVAAATPKGAPAATKPTQSALSKAQVPAVVASKPSEAWSVVGKSGNAVKPVVAPTPPAAPSTVKPAVVPRVVPAAASKTTAATRPASAAAPAAKRGPSGPSDALVQWCRQALKPLERSSASANVDEFIQILFMIPINESATTVSICDDTLGGLTAMDARKFAEEFLRRRRNDIENPGWTIAGSATKAGSSAGLPASAVIGPSSLNKFETANSFTVVSGKGGKKKKK
ncbi:hypothetical protein DFJ73DRAFT_18127 [Zopfochytrium polystomum]|nr:hypothetical protein DFJ73DRAFT_18127 [Zopfochytrium polystomum]